MSDLQEALEDENKRIRRLRLCIDFAQQCLMTQPMSLIEAEALIAGVRSVALTLFPGKEAVFDLIYLPRLQRALRESRGNRPARRLTVIAGGRTPSDGQSVARDS
ncbi:MAG: hypothetical protein AB1646_09580 [Thermodesulfobacteriota bacterium]